MASIAQPCSDCDLNCITCESIDGFSANNGSPTAGSSQGTHCTALEHQITWVGFIAGSEDLSLDVCVDACQGGNNTRLEVIIVEAVDCSNASAVSNCYGFTSAISEGDCEDVSTTTDLVVGQYYWLVFDVTNGSGDCDYTLQVTSGSTGAVDLNEEPELEGEIYLCDRERERFIPEEQDGVSGYMWTLDGDDEGIMDEYLFRASDPGVYELCAIPFNFCHEGPEGCVDVYVGESYEETLFFEICKEDGCVEWEGDFYCWEGKEEAVDEETWIGCDSIVYLDISYYNPIQDITIGPFEICEGEELDLDDLDFFWDNDFDIVDGDDEYMLAGTYMVTVEDGEYECEYYIEFTLDVIDTDSIFMDVDICENETYFFDNRELEFSGIYYDSLLNVAGCDSFTFLTLTVKPTSESDIERVICKDQPITVADTIIRDPGVYKIITPSYNGCDSSITVSVTIADTLRNSLTETICEGDSVFFTDTYYNEAGLYRRALISDTGCDSVVTLELRVNDDSEYFISPTICEGQSYEVAGQFISAEGPYEYNIPNSMNCDSFISVDLNVIETKYEDITVEICEGDSTLVGGTYFKSAGNFSVTTDAMSGCDSIINLDVRVLTPYSLTITESICAGDSFLFEGINYLETGIYTEAFSSIDGCDSIRNLDLTVLDQAIDLTLTERCEGEIYNFGTEQIQTTGYYERYPTGPDGCDSLVQLDIIFYPVDNIGIERTLCAGDSILFFGTYYKSSGTYSGMTQNQYDCDSLVTLDLTVRDQLTTTVYDTFCISQEIPFGNLNVSTSGSYEQNFISNNGCDSLVTLIAQFNDCSLDIDINNSDVKCFGKKNGSITIDLLNFFPPLSFQLIDPQGEEVDPLFISFSPDVVTIDSLGVGTYSMNILDGQGTTNEYQTTIAEPTAIVSEAILSEYNGYQLSCNGARDGSIQVEIQGGVPPYGEVNWSDGAIGAFRGDMEEGLYAYFSEDSNGCKTKGMINLRAPLEIGLDYELVLDPCSAENIDLDYEAVGGLPPLDVEIYDQGALINTSELTEGNYTLLVTDINSCTKEYDLLVPYQEIPELNLDAPLEVTQGEIITVVPEIDASIEIYNWSVTPSVDDLCLNCDRLEFISQETQYTIELMTTDENGCDYTSAVIVDVDLPLSVFIPNILNTNDPENDKFRIFYSEAITLTEFRIYSRWGELMFDPDLSGENEDIFWDGTRNGARIEAGVYVYVIQYIDDNGEPVLTTGDITVF